MKRLFLFATLVILTSFSNLPESKTLPNGKYAVVLGQNYKDAGLNEFEITIKDSLFTAIMFDQSEMLELKWISETAFIVKGYTEPLYTASLPFWDDSSEKFAFHINKHQGDAYYFHLGTKADTYPVLVGKLVLIK